MIKKNIMKLGLAPGALALYLAYYIMDDAERSEMNDEQVMKDLNICLPTFNKYHKQLVNAKLISSSSRKKYRKIKIR